MKIVVLLGAILLFALGLSGGWRILRRITFNTKTMARTGAVLSFIFFLLGGLWLLILATLDPRDSGPILIVVGLYLLGKAFYAGTRLWLAAEKCGPLQGAK